MIPQVKLITRTQIEWPLLRKSISDIVGLQPSLSITQSPVKFTEAAEFLLFTAYLYLDITNTEPYDILLKLPRECMEFLHYTFIILCDRDVVDDLREKTRAHYTMTDVGKGYCVLGTGPLSIWYDAIVLNLTHPNITFKSLQGTRSLLNILLLFFETKEGLGALFKNYSKKQLPDKTFLLEE